jgi:hypothetical protein
MEKLVGDGYFAAHDESRSDIYGGPAGNPLPRHSRQLITVDRSKRRRPVSRTLGWVSTVRFLHGDCSYQRSSGISSSGRGLVPTS